MQRFRKRKGSTRSEPASPELLSGSAARKNAPSSPLLPENSFRQSLILPHLTKRFALLRSEDGQLVSLSDMEAHLAKHRQTGVLSALEVEMTLKEYSVQAAYEQRSVPRLSPTIYRPTHNFSRSSPSEEDSSIQNRTISYRSDTTNDSERLSSASSIGGHSSAFPFPYDSASPPESPVAVTSANFRRGGNSMFGGRVKTMAQLKMVKSGSANSLKSMARPDGADRSPSIEIGDEGEDTVDGASLSESSGTASGLRSRTVSHEEEKADELARREKDSARLRPPPLDLTQNQLHRISRVLDDYEAELSATYTRIRSESQFNVPLSPSYSDTEAIDPHYHRLTVSPAVNDYRRPSTASIAESTHTLTSGQATPLTNSDPATPFLSTAIPRLSIDDHDDPAEPAVETGSPLHPSIFPFSAPDEGLFARKASLTIPDEDREGSFISSNGGTPHSTATSTFPNLPSRSGDNDNSDDGPFDLSYTPSAAWSRSFASTSERKDDFAPEPVPTIGIESQRSSGSSYHATGVESDDDGGLTKTKSVNGKGKGREDDNEEREEDGGLLSASTMSRVPSEDLIRELRRSESGDVDLALHDLVLIQETLVRSASRKAARSIGAGTPTSVSESEIGLARSASSRGRDSRIASFSDGRSVSDYRASQGEAMESNEIVEANDSVDGNATAGELSDSSHQIAAPSSLGAPVLLDPAPQLRTRNNRRDPASTTSMYVREKADAATIALRKAGPVSPGTRLVKSKSIRNIAISNPHFVSGPTDIPAVPIIPAALRDQKELDVDVRRTKSTGIGFRFKMLVKKQSNKELSHLSGDEITPFIDFETTPSPATTPPFTPPSADSPNFSVVTPSDYPRTPEPIRSPDYYRSPGLRRVEDTDRKSPAVGASPGATLTRLVTRLRRIRKHSDVSGTPLDATGVVHISQDASNQHQFDNALSSSSTLHLSSSTRAARHISGSTPVVPAPTPVPIATTIDEEGSNYLGIDGPAGSRSSSTESSGRAAVQYDVSSSRRRGIGSGGEPLASTAPLSLSKGRISQSTGLDSALQDAPSGTGHRATGSIVSIDQLRKVAQELGLSEAKAEEFVNLSYGRQVDSIVSSPQLDVSPKSSPDNDESIIPLGTPSRGLRIDTAGRRDGVGSGPQSPVSPTGQSIRSLRSSGYAGSVFDLYGDGDGPEEADGYVEQGVDVVEEEVTRAETKEEEEDREVYQVLDEIRNNNRESVDYSLGDSTALFRPNSASTATTTSSSVEEVEEPHSIEENSYDPVIPSPIELEKKPEAFSELVSRHRRNQSSISQQTYSTSQPLSNSQSQFAASYSQYNHETRAHQESDPYNPRYPSIYVRDEKRLHGLADGLAEADEGLFLVRPKQNTTGFI